nr:SKP1-like protein 21 isoform X1 [Tanacetum cinerariifolium]
MAMVKPEMKSFIWLQTPDELIQQVEEEVAMFCPMICREERKTFDEKFIRLDSNKLCELISAADSLKLRPLVDLTASALARMIEGKTAEQIRETFHIVDDLTEEEKLEPLKIRTNDPRVRLLNRLYARKRKELKARKNLKNVEIEEERVDDRSVDDLLLFINSGNEDSKGVKPTKNKKKNRRRKNNPKEPSSDSKNGNHKKETDSLSSSHNSEIEDCVSPSKLLKMLGSDFDFPEDDFDDDL